MQALPAFFFFTDPAPTQIYTLSLHDALPIWIPHSLQVLFSRTVSALASRTSSRVHSPGCAPWIMVRGGTLDRKSTRLNSSHVRISYAVFCLKKKKPYPPTPPLLSQATVSSIG